MNFKYLINYKKLYFLIFKFFSLHLVLYSLIIVFLISNDLRNYIFLNSILRNLFIVLLFIISFSYLLRNSKRISINKINLIDLSVLILLLNYFFGIILLLIYKNNIILFKSIHVSILPIMVYISTRLILLDEDILKNKYFNQYLNYLIVLLTIIILISLFLHFIKPNFYIEYLSIHRNESITWAKSYHRLSGILLQPNTFASFSTILFILLYFYKEIYTTYSTKIYLNILLLIVLVASILTLSRGVWLFLAIFFLIKIITKIKLKIKKKVFYYVLFTFFTLILVMPKLNYNKYLNYIIHRYNSIVENKEAFDRSNYWIPVIKNAKTYPLGQGLGIGGQITNEYPQIIQKTNTPVIDGYFIKVFAETGFIGFFAFIFFILVFILIYYKISINPFSENYKKNFSMYFYLILLFLFQSIGSNIFDFINISPFIWFFISIYSSLYNIRKNY